MEAVKLSDEDVAKVATMYASESAVHAELGMLRDEFLQREGILMQKLQGVRDERAALLGALGRHYVNGDVEQWAFRPDLMSFVSRQPKEAKEQDKNYGNSDQLEEPEQQQPVG